MAKEKYPQYPLGEAAQKWPCVIQVKETLEKLIEMRACGELHQPDEVTYNLTPKFPNAYIDLRDDNGGFLSVDRDYKGNWVVWKLVLAPQKIKNGGAANK